MRHALTHIDPKERPKPYKCQYCGKDYTEVTGYKHHLRSVHTGEKTSYKVREEIATKIRLAILGRVT